MRDVAVAHPVGELLTTADAARIAGVVPDTLRLWQRLGKIQPAFQTPSGIRLYRRDDVERRVFELRGAHPSSGRET